MERNSQVPDICPSALLSQRGSGSGNDVSEKSLSEEPPKKARAPCGKATLCRNGKKKRTPREKGISSYWKEKNERFSVRACSVDGSAGPVVVAMRTWLPRED